MFFSHFLLLFEQFSITYIQAIVTRLTSHVQKMPQNSDSRPSDKLPQVLVAQYLQQNPWEPFQTIDTLHCITPHKIQLGICPILICMHLQTFQLLLIVLFESIWHQNLCVVFCSKFYTYITLLLVLCNKCNRNFNEVVGSIVQDQVGGYFNFFSKLVRRTTYSIQEVQSYITQQG